MEQKKVIAHQLELFDINGVGVICHSSNRKGVPLADGAKALQVDTAGEQGRALVYNLTSNYETLNNLQKLPCTKVHTVV